MIVGRTSLLSSLDQAFDATEGGQSSAVLLLGEPGMGKSAVADVARSDATQRGWSVVAAAAPEGSSTVAFALVHDLAHDLLPPGGHMPGTQHSTLESLDEANRAQVQGVATALRELLLEAAADRPVLVVVDDLHWADDDSVSTLALAAARIPAARVALLATAWPSLASDPRLLAWRHLNLDPLPEPDAVRLLQSVARAPLDGAQAARAARALGYCPLALVECERLLTPAQLAGREPMPEPIPVGQRLRHEWLLVVAGLPVATQRGLLAVSVLDYSSPVVLHEVLGAVGCREADLDPAIEFGLLVPSARGAPVTANDFVRAAVIDAHDPVDVRAMHRLVADVAARLGSPPAVAIHHLRRGALVGDEAAVAALEANAERAHAAAQPEVAARAWQAAAELSLLPAKRASRAVRAARVWLSEAISVEGAASLLQVLNDSPLSPDDTVWREWTRAEVLAESDLAESASAALQAARHAEATQPALVPWLLWDAAATSWMADDPELGMVAASRLMAWSTSDAAPDAAPAPTWLASAILGVACLHAGRTRDGVALVQAARAAANEWRGAATTPLSELVNVVALDELLVADGPEEQSRVHDLATRLTDDGGTTSSVLTIQGWRACRRGDWVVARGHAADAVELARAVRAPAQERAALLLLAHVLHAATADPAAPASADDALFRLEALASHVGDRRALAAGDRVVGLRDLAQGRVSAAVLALERARASRCRGRGTADHGLPAAVDLVEALVRSGDTAAAQPLAREVAADLDAMAALDANASALAARARALISPAAHADEQFEMALAAHQSGGDDFESARTRMLYGEHLRRTRRSAAGRHALLAAAAQMDTLGADEWARRAREQAGTPGRRPRRSDPAWRTRLTAQERRVVHEVCRGATNAEAATALSLSTRTVECHLASAYRKLGVRNRVELANLVRTAASRHDSADEPGTVSEPARP